MFMGVARGTWSVVSNLSGFAMIVFVVVHFVLHGTDSSYD